MKTGRVRFFQLHKLGVSAYAGIYLLGLSWLIWGIVFVSQDITYVRISRTGFPVPNWLLGVGLIIVLLMSIKETVSGWSYYADFEDGMIKTKGHRFMPPQSRFQFKLQIRIKDITAIRVIKSHYNSNKKPNPILACSAPIPTLSLRWQTVVPSGWISTCFPKNSAFGCWILSTRNLIPITITKQCIKKENR